MTVRLDVTAGSGDEAWRRGLREAQEERVAERLWNADHTLWGRYPVGILDRLGWLDAPEAMRAQLPELRAFADEVRGEGLTHALVVGMGGASLASEMLRDAYGVRDGSLDVEVVDTTHPDALRALTARIRPETTLIVLSMKAWALESYTIFLHLYRVFADALGRSATNRRVAVITDPDAWVLPFARRSGFRRVFVNDPFVGGRFAAHTYVGLLPAALLGVDMDGFLDRTASVRERCRPAVEEGHPFATALGAFVGDLAVAGRDKITLLAPPRLRGWAAWLEQLLAESLGKEGTGVVPIVDEDASAIPPSGNDRTIVSVTVGATDEAAQDTADLARHGHPIARISLDDVSDVGGLCFLWMFATAVAGNRLGVQPFDQPDVEATKARTTELLHRPSPPGLAGGAPERDALQVRNDEDATRAARAVAELVQNTGSSGYVGLQAYVARDGGVDADLHDLRRTLGERTDRPVTLGIGPRFLHSTGQLHKGDAGNGRFIQLITSPKARIPAVSALDAASSELDFATLNLAQAQGDAAALREAGRAVLRLDLGDAPGATLRMLVSALRPTRTDQAEAADEA